MLGRFPFGAPVIPCGAEIPDQSDGFVLGAYPSAVHVTWTPPESTGLKRISALAVDNEPSVFWDGADGEDRVATWRERYFDPAWGNVFAARLNGPSGAWLATNVRDPMNRAGVRTHFVTDCLTTYRLSVGAARRIEDTYEPMAEKYKKLQSAVLASHPSESAIVTETLKTESARLTTQLQAAKPQLLVTLGNAAARVIQRLAEEPGSGKLVPNQYGSARTVTLGGRQLRWLALVHPATPQVWQERHRDWLAESGFTRL
jgi:hypothetical protein